MQCKKAIITLGEEDSVLAVQKVKRGNPSSVHIKKVQLLPIECEAVCWQGNKRGREDRRLHFGVGGVKLRTLRIFLQQRRTAAEETPPPFLISFLPPFFPLSLHSTPLSSLPPFSLPSFLPPSFSSPDTRLWIPSHSESTSDTDVCASPNSPSWTSRW